GVLERDVELAAHQPLRVVGEADAAGLGKRFDARRHVHAVAENIAGIQDDVAEVDADAELDAALRRQAFVALGHAALDVKRAAQRVDHAAELRQQAVAGVLDDASAVPGDAGIDDDAQVLL